MNETVKAALLRMRDRARSSIGIAIADVASLKRTLAVSEAHLESERGRLADIELHLRDNGVDLAAVDAEAEKARAKSSALSNGLLTQSYEQQISSMRDMANQQPDIMAGLAKALDEA